MDARKITTTAKTEEPLQVSTDLKQTLLAGVSILRPKQWTKNLILFAGLVFSHNLFDLSLFWVSSLAFISFCLLSGAVYVINDLVDIQEDLNHPKKKNRPLPSGRLTIKQAVFIFAASMGLSLITAWALGIYFLLIAMLYFALVVSYSFWLKHIVIFDIFAISLGFLLRVIAGAVVIDVRISPWLLICTLLLSLFLALTKRRYEFVSLENDGVDHRRVLEQYSVAFLDQLISIVTATTIMAYSLYSFTASDTEQLMITIPFVIFGLFRYLFLVYKKDMGGSPEEVLFKDKPFIFNLLLWVLTSVVLLYWHDWAPFS